MNFFDPDYILWFLSIPVLLLLFGYAHWRWSRIIARNADSSLIKRLTSVSPWLYYGRKFLLVVCVAILVLALMRPRWGSRVSVEKELGIDLAVIVDISNSMNARDISPSRLKRVLTEVNQLANLLEGNRLSLVLFAGAAFIQCPLTTDANALKLFLETVNSDMINLQGTNIEEALNKAGEVLDTKFKRNRIILLFSDGETHSGDAVHKARSLYKELGIRSFTVAVGTEAGGRIPKNADPFAEDSGEYIRTDDGDYAATKTDLGNLRNIAEASGGKFYRLGHGNFQITRLADDINDIEKQTIGEQKIGSMVDRHQPFIALALFFLLLFLIIPERRPSL